MDSIGSLMSRVRRKVPTEPWETLPQPVPLVKVVAQPIAPGSSSIRYVATGITVEAEAILSQLPVPLYIVAFAGFGRSGKSYTATQLRAKLTGNTDHKFHSAPGNVPITHGIDMVVFQNPAGPGHIVFLDCEGGANHNQTALPFVIGLAARLASRMYVFERGCFTTGGLDTVMQVINMGHATSADRVSITKSVVLVENMSINQEIPNDTLLHDLLNEEDGDETTNRVRKLIKEKFQIEFNKLPFDQGMGSALHSQICSEMGAALLENLVPFEIGSVPVDGTLVVNLVNELISQIRGGGSKFNMVSATEALVSNMATEAANTVWIEFVDKVRKMGNHPIQINGRKHLRTIMREVEGVANIAMNELDQFVSKLEPAEAAQVGRQVWDRNYHNFQADIRAAHQRKTEELARYSQWSDRANRFIQELVQRIVEAIRQFIRFARFSTTLILMSNYYAWKHGINLVKGVAQGVMS
ncbi:Guanylate-binding protein 6 [Polyrhizophydium stewartii]|uniref:Guanylate-binding protein 6 n=1 Tax=Polyrhizophydium stewartii TaxID=2732419 RepID=A0ABR4MZ15_9FUNG|nr:hypothetical protein HK105_000618 [Polyrhizophydium stewartii]